MTPFDSTDAKFPQPGSARTSPCEVSSGQSRYDQGGEYGKSVSRKSPLASDCQFGQCRQLSLAFLVKACIHLAITRRSVTEPTNAFLLVLLVLTLASTPRTWWTIQHGAHLASTGISTNYPDLATSQVFSFPFSCSFSFSFLSTTGITNPISANLSCALFSSTLCLCKYLLHIDHFGEL